MHSIRLRPVRGCVLLAAVLWWWPESRATAQAPANRTAAALEDGVDPAIRPGDDFFGFANGAWLKSAVIPSGRDRWTARTEIGERTSRQIAQLLDDAPAQPRGSLARKVADFRAAYLNEGAIETRGIA